MGLSAVPPVPVPSPVTPAHETQNGDKSVILPEQLICLMVKLKEVEKKPVTSSFLHEQDSVNHAPWVGQENDLGKRRTSHPIPSDGTQSSHEIHSNTGRPTCYPSLKPESGIIDQGDKEKAHANLAGISGRIRPTSQPVKYDKTNGEE